MSKIKRGKTQHPNQPDKIHKDKRNEVTYRLIKEFKRVPVQSMGNGNYYAYWLVQWSSNQSQGGTAIPSPVVLEKRRIYIRKDGTIRTSKLAGWTREDLAYLATIWGEIQQLV